MGTARFNRVKSLDGNITLELGDIATKDELVSNIVDTSTGEEDTADALDRRVVYSDTEAGLSSLTPIAGQVVKTARKDSSSLFGGASFRWSGSEFERLGDSVMSVADFGATYGADDTAAVVASLSEVGYVYVPAGKTCRFKNVELSEGDSVFVDGTISLPDACSDFDRLLHASNKPDITIRVNTIDGNYAGQSGDAGTHLVYLVDCEDAEVVINKLHDHYYPRSFVSASSPDGERNSGTGAIFLVRCHGSIVFVNRMRNWGHEGVYILESNHVVAYLGFGQGSWDGDEYSGIQISGDYCSLLYAKVDLAGATGIGFDVRWGVAGQLVSTRSRFFNGVNLGHDGIPATGSVIDSILVDGCDDNGINFTSETDGAVVNSFVVKNAGQYGVSQSNLATNNRLSNGTIATSRGSNINFFDSRLVMNNVSAYSLFPQVLNFSSISTDFQVDETVTGQSSGATGYVQYAWNSTRKFVQITNLTGTFTNGETVTGSSGGSGVFDVTNSPSRLTKSGSFTEEFTKVRLSLNDPINTTFVGIGGQLSVTVTNANVRENNMPTISPANTQGASALLYISNVSDGNFTVETGTGASADGGAGFRYSLP